LEGRGQMDQKEAPATDPAAEAKSDEQPARGVEVYDFRNPNRLSREQLRKIEFLHTSFAKRLGMVLAGLLRESVGVEVEEVKEMHYSEMVDSVSVPGATFTFKVEPFEGMGILDIDLILAFSLVDRLFGGAGEPLPEERELTTIEQNVVGKIASKILREVDAAWKRQAEVAFTSPEFVPSLEFVHSVGSNESVVWVRLAIQTAKVNAHISLGYHYLTCESVFKLAAKAPEAAGGKPDKGNAERVMAVVPLEVSARLPVSNIRFEELMNLDAGDVLVLDSRVSDEVVVSVGQKRIFAGRPGRSRGNLAVKVTRVFREGGAEDESS